MVSDECEYCGSERVAPVLDKRIEQSPTAGNKYRTRCLSCWRWLPMTSADAWKESQLSKVLPATADPEQPDNLVEPEEAPDGRLEELKEKVASQGVDTHQGEEVAADGGQPEVEDVEDDEQDEEEANTFDCPATDCGATHSGYPDECDECGAPYKWGDEDDDEDQT